MTHVRDSAEVLLRWAAAAENEDERSAIVRGLHGRTDRPSFEAVCAYARSSDLRERTVGLDILGQIGYLASRPFRDETVPVILACCEDDRPDVLNSAIVALGHLADRRGLPAVLRAVTNPSGQVRVAAAVALPAVAGDPPADEAVAALIGLTADPDPDVRDWATMGLSSTRADSAAVRGALSARLTDQGGDTAGEALLGLAERKDPGALAPLLACLDSGHPGNLVVEAAAALGAAEALPALLRLKDNGWQDSGSRSSVLDAAIAACS
jgi:HEAT repeat protein